MSRYEKLPDIGQEVFLFERNFCDLKSAIRIRIPNYKKCKG